MTEYTEINARHTPTAWAAGWYVVTGDATISGRVTVSGDVHLVLTDGASLTVNGGISCKDTDSLTIYGQKEGTGTLTAQNASGGNAGIGGDSMAAQTSGNCGTVTINGGVITAFGGPTVG